MDNKYRAKLMSRALRDLDNIYTYIARNLLEQGTAEKLIDTLEGEILSLESMPYRCAERRVGVYAGKGIGSFLSRITPLFFALMRNIKPSSLSRCAIPPANSDLV